MTSYAWRDACRVLGAHGVTYRKLDYWTTTGQVLPVGDASPGHGRPRRWAWRELQSAMVLARLRRVLGDGLQVDRAVVDALLAGEPGDIGDGVTIGLDATFLPPEPTNGEAETA